MNSLYQRITGVFQIFFGKSANKPQKQDLHRAEVRGIPRLKKDEHGLELCVCCMLCSDLCPTEAISITPAVSTDEMLKQNPLNRRYPRRYEINAFQCILCGVCEEVCPTGAIDLSSTQPEPLNSRHLMVHNKRKLYLN